MKKMEIILIVMACILLAAVMMYHPPEQYVIGRLYIRERGIATEVYTTEQDPIDGMSTLWSGGKVTTKADLSAVQVGDMAELYTVEGEHLVLECIDIRKGWGWFERPQGDVVVIDGRWVCRLTRL